MFIFFCTLLGTRAFYRYCTSYHTVRMIYRIIRIYHTVRIIRNTNNTWYLIPDSLIRGIEGVMASWPRSHINMNLSTGLQGTRYLVTVFVFVCLYNYRTTGLQVRVKVINNVSTYWPYSYILVLVLV